MHILYWIWNNENKNNKKETKNQLRLVLFLECVLNPIHLYLLPQTVLIIEVLGRLVL